MPRDFIIGLTPVPEDSTEEDDEIVYSPEVQEIEEEQTEDPSEEIEEEKSDKNPEEEGEFGGYKLGNVYYKKKKAGSLKEADPKNVPPELLITKGDPTRL